MQRQDWCLVSNQILSFSTISLHASTVNLVGWPQISNHCMFCELAGLFHCVGTDICLQHSEVCDGVTQCPIYGEDERYCDTPGTAVTYTQSTKVHVRIQSGDDVIPRSRWLAEWFWRDVDGCCLFEDPVCSACHCDGALASCQNRNLTTLPTAQEFARTKTRILRGLFASKNQIAAITRDMLAGLHWLTRLDFSENRIQSIENLAFQPLRNLLFVDLSFNLLQKLTSATFEGLSHLTYLNLKSNQLDTIDQSHVSMMTSLRHLIVEDNDLNNVEKGVYFINISGSSFEYTEKVIIK